MTTPGTTIARIIVRNILITILPPSYLENNTETISSAVLKVMLT